MTYYMHNVPGRLRIKIPQLKKNPTLAPKVQQVAESMLGVLSTQLNLLTGSVVILYEPSLVQSEQILETLDRHGYFDLDRIVTNEEYIRDKASRATKLVGRLVGGTFVDVALQGSGLSFLSVLI